MPPAHVKKHAQPSSDDYVILKEIDDDPIMMMSFHPYVASMALQ
jgi:hypothetical protein